MTDAVNRFYSSVEGANGLNQTALVEIFAYYLTVEAGNPSATAKDVAECFVACDLTVPKNIGARFSEGLKTKPAKYIKTPTGYKLQRHMREQLSKKLGGESVTLQTSAALRAIEHKLPAGSDKDFLKETIDCFESGANRATVVMAWILAMDHLFAHIMAHKLAEFDAVLAKNTDRAVKIKSISTRDDFMEMKEKKFIELCREAKIISNDVRKILDQKLETRNTCAHPSGVTISKTKVIDFVEDLVENVVLKFPV